MLCKFECVNIKTGSRGTEAGNAVMLRLLFSIHVKLIQLAENKNRTLHETAI